jgi:hypothetical protein
MSTTTAIRCQSCNQPLSPAVNDAICELYHGGELASFRAQLAALVKDPLPGADDRALFDEALKRWCGASAEEIVQAVRHVEVEEWEDGD